MYEVRKESSLNLLILAFSWFGKVWVLYKICSPVQDEEEFWNQFSRPHPQRAHSSSDRMLACPASSTCHYDEDVHFRCGPHWSRKHPAKIKFQHPEKSWPVKIPMISSTWKHNGQRGPWTMSLLSPCKCPQSRYCPRVLFGTTNNILHDDLGIVKK